MPLALASYEALYQEINEVLRKYSETLTPLELLAILSNMTGKVLALQDQRKITPAQAIEVVSKNIELGNRQVIDALQVGEAKGTA